MKNLLLIAKLDILESIRSKWFLVYLIIFGGLMGLFFVTGITDAVVMGFTGLSRLLLVYIQVSIVILPIFILVTTVKSISEDRESLVLEYMLSFPVSLKDYYWGKFVGRFAIVFTPVILALFLGVIWGISKGGEGVPWGIVLLYSGLIFSMSFLFLGIAFFVSTIVKSHDVAIGASFIIWITLLGFIDIALIALMLQNRFDDNAIIAIALINPLEVFRVGAILLFDPELTVMGPVAYYLIDTFGRVLFLIYSLIYPFLLGAFFACSGYYFFKKRDLL
jgi:ABC-2 type transport system permease protein